MSAYVFRLILSKMEKQVIRVALVEDQHLIRQSLAGLIGGIEDVRLVMEAANGNRFIELLEEDASYLILRLLI